MANILWSYIIRMNCGRSEVMRQFSRIPSLEKSVGNLLKRVGIWNFLISGIFKGITQQGRGLISSSIVHVLVFDSGLASRGYRLAWSPKLAGREQKYQYVFTQKRHCITLHIKMYHYSSEKHGINSRFLVTVSPESIVPYPISDGTFF